MKKFIIRDEGKEYEVEEVETTAKDGELTTPTTKPTKDESLTSEETLALKKLAGVADKLVAMVEKADCSATDEDEDKDDDDKDVIDADEDEDDGTVVDTDEEESEMKFIKKDSKQSVGSIEKKVRSNDSLDSRELEVASAWQKRYGGNK